MTGTKSRAASPRCASFHDALLAHGSAPFWALRKLMLDSAQRCGVWNRRTYAALRIPVRKVRASLRGDPEVFRMRRSTVCPKCGGHVVKLLSSPAIQFKGSGWYITDYAQSGQQGQLRTAKTTRPRVVIDLASESNETKSSEDRDEDRSEDRDTEAGIQTRVRTVGPSHFKVLRYSRKRSRELGTLQRESRRSPSGIPACCRCRGGRRRSPARRSVATSAGGAGHW